MRRAALLLLLAAFTCLAAQAAAIGDDTVPLAFKFAPGDVLRYDVSLTGSGGFNGPDGEVSPVGLRGAFSIGQTAAGGSRPGFPVAS
jgi:hypothetical protein